MSDEREPWRVKWDELEPEVRRLLELLAEAESAGEGARLDLSLREVVALRIAAENGLRFPRWVERLEQARNVAEPARRAEAVMRDDPEKRTAERARKAVQAAGWGRLDKRTRDRRMAVAYAELVQTEEPRPALELVAQRFGIGASRAWTILRDEREADALPFGSEERKARIPGETCWAKLGRFPLPERPRR